MAPPIFVLYREYVNDFARPAFFQELRYVWLGGRPARLAARA